MVDTKLKLDQFLDNSEIPTREPTEQDIGDPYQQNLKVTQFDYPQRLAVLGQNSRNKGGMTYSRSQTQAQARGSLPGLRASKT